MTDNRKACREVLGSMLGEQFAAGLETAADSGDFGAPLAQLAIDFAFAGVWSRPGLDRRSRSIATMSILLTTGQTHEFKNHVRAGIANGVTPSEIEELIIHSSAYVGLPTAGIAMQAATEVLRELGKLPTSTKTSQERGLT
jgi:alkylhydroperoxidase/carboxymuconolactone decarboxylase family protein YurZ